MINNTAEQKQVKISLISYPKTPQDVANAEKGMLPFAKAITGYWQPIKTWTPIALALSQNGLHLTPPVLAILAAALVFCTIEKRRHRKAETNTYNKLSTEDQKIMDAAQQTRKTSPPTLFNIAATYQDMTHRDISIEVLTEKLPHGEESGLLSSQIVNQNDEPMAAWKTNFKPKQTKPKPRPTDLLRRRLYALRRKHSFAFFRRNS